MPAIGIGKEQNLINWIKRMSPKEVADALDRPEKQKFISFAVNTSAGQTIITPVKKDRGIREAKEGFGIGHLDSNHVCDHCNNRGAYARELETYADEPPIIIWTCTKCKKTDCSRGIGLT